MKKSEEQKRPKAKAIVSAAAAVLAAISAVGLIIRRRHGKKTK